MGAAKPSSALHRYVVACAALGVAGGGALLSSVGFPWPPSVGRGGSWALPVLVVLVVLIHLGAVQFFDTSRDGEAHSLDEFILVASLLLLVPPWPWVVMVGGALITELRRGRDLLRMTFNLAWYSAATAVAIGVHRVLPWSDPFEPLGLLAVTLALFSSFATNWLMMAGIKVNLGARRNLLAAVFDSKFPVAAVSATSVGALGVIAAYLLRSAPHLAPLLAVPLFLVRQRSFARQVAEEARREEHRRLERTVAAASDGIALIDEEGLIAVWNDAMSRLSGIPSEQALGLTPGSVLHLQPIDAPPVGSEVTHVLERQDGARRLVAVERTRVELTATASGTVVLVRDVTAGAEVVMLREDLISRVSHELRTPLTSITGLLQTVTGRWSQLDDATRLGLLERSLGAGQRLSRLVDGMLARGRIEHGTARPDRVVVALDELIDRVVAEVEVSLDVRVERQRSATQALVDPDHLAQILIALLENAVRYGRPPVEISTSGSPDGARLTVRDHGDGVPEDFLTQLFEPFTQASTGLRRTASGLGLGLSIARELTEANGGQLGFVAPAGGGASFVVTLPVVTGGTELTSCASVARGGGPGGEPVDGRWSEPRGSDGSPAVEHR